VKSAEGSYEQVIRDILSRGGTIDSLANVLLTGLKAEWNVVEECDHWFEEPYGNVYEMCLNEGCFVRYGEIE
jgi:hypothetical protein